MATCFQSERVNTRKREVIEDLAIHRAKGESRISIFEVAKIANCSTCTVSNVLNQKGRVSAATRNAVLRAVEESGFRANSAGRNLRLRRSDILGLLVYPSCTEIFKNPFYAEIIEGLQESLTEKGYHLLLAGYEGSAKGSPLPDFLLQGKVDGLILMGRFPLQIVQRFRKLSTPLLLLETDLKLEVDSVIGYYDQGDVHEGRPFLSTARVNEKELGRIGVELILKRIASIGEPNSDCPQN